MQVPLHPLMVHFPVALTFILPVLILVFTYMIRKNKMAPKAWLIIIGLQLVIVITGYISLETGENEEHTVEKVMSKNFIHEHEESAEIFVGSTVLALVISIGAFFIRKEIQIPVKMIVALISLVSCFLGYKTGHSGGELVYKHGAASAYVQSEPVEGILPTPELNTSESVTPMDENESLKPDDNDYGNSDEVNDSIDEDGKQED